MDKEAPLHFLNGKPLEKEGAFALAESTAFLYGYSAFTTSKISNGVWSFGEKHLERLSQNGEALFGKKLPEEYIVNSVRLVFNDYLKSSKDTYSHRFTLFENRQGQLFHLQTFVKLEEENLNGFKKNFETVKSFSHDSLSHFKDQGIKVGNYSETLFAHRNLAEPYIYLDQNENYSEGSICNFILFDERDNKWVTPLNPSRVLKGIGVTYGLIGLEVEERRITFSEKENFSAMFALNSLRGICPIDVWDNRALEKSRHFAMDIEETFRANEERWSVVL